MNLRKIVRWSTNTVIIGVPIAAYIGLPIAAWVYYWGIYYPQCHWGGVSGNEVICPNPSYFSNHPISVCLMGVFWGGGIVAGVIMGCIRLWKWSHVEENIAEDGAGSGSGGTIEVNIDRNQETLL